MSLKPSDVFGFLISTTLIWVLFTVITGAWTIDPAGYHFVYLVRTILPHKFFWAPQCRGQTLEKTQILKQSRDRCLNSGLPSLQMIAIICKQMIAKNNDFLWPCIAVHNVCNTLNFTQFKKYVYTIRNLHLHNLILSFTQFGICIYTNLILSFTQFEG